MTAPPLSVRRDDGVVRITLDRPHKLNAVDDDTWLALRHACVDIADRRDDRVVILTGAGRAFCSGTDFTTLHVSDDHFANRMRRVTEAILALHRLPQPTIAQVNGVAVGVGANLALACDLVVACASASFGEVFSKLALSVDGGGSWILPRLIGPQKAKELAFFGDVLGAEEAAALGLVNSVVPDDLLADHVDALARRLRSGPPLALAATKRMINEAFERSLSAALEAEASAQVVNVATEDASAAAKARHDGHEPRFVGR